MFKSVRFVLLASAIAFMAWPICYFVTHRYSVEFYGSTLGNLFATVIGVLVGVPVAMEITRWGQSATEATEKKTRVERKRLVLGLLQGELRRDQAEIERLNKPVASGGKRIVATPPLAEGLWESFSDGGELQYLNSPGLLAKLANAYEQVNACIWLERKYLDILYYPGQDFASRRALADEVLGFIVKADIGLTAALDEAISAIELEIKSLDTV